MSCKSRPDLATGSRDQSLRPVVSVYALTGLTDNAPDFGAGLRLTWRADFRRPTED